jgi:glutamate 5-kinase
MASPLIDPAALFSPAACPRLVVKIGSSLLVDTAGRVRREWLAGVVGEIAERQCAGQRVIIVSSGSIALGARRLGLAKGGRASLEDAQASAAVGQIALSHVWAELLGDHRLTAAQMLVTLDDLEDRRRYLNAVATLDRLTALDVVPVVNENDSVATAEIRFGDNDRLAARIAQAGAARGVILLSDVDGLYTANPQRDETARLVPLVSRIDGKVATMADSGSASGMGSGGMNSKIEAARIATRAGVTLAIIAGTVDKPLTRFAETGRGTVFTAQKGATARKAWLAGRLTAKGRVHVDAGAAAALGNGRSLLAAGAVSVEGRFERGDVVDIVGPDGIAIARGLIEYDAADAAKITGRRSDALPELLGYAPRSALIHRNQMVLL